jgi:gluconate 5-dehydrogenase
MDMKHATLLVTGGSAGIGEAIARRAPERGARVVINGRDQARPARTSSSLQGSTGSRMAAAPRVGWPSRGGFV